MARLQPASGAAAMIAALLWARLAYAQAPDAVPTSGAPLAGAPLPALVHVMPIPCGSGLLDVPAFASALRVELMQQGVRAVDIVRPDASPSDVPATIVELRAEPCDSGARAVTFTIRGLEPTAPSRSGTIGLGDVDFASRPRVAALAVAEAFEAAQHEANAAPALAPGGPPPGEAPASGATTAAPSTERNSTATSGLPVAPPNPASPAGAGNPVAPSTERNVTASSALPVAPANQSSTTIPLGGSGPAPLAQANDRLVLSATLDLRDFTSYATGLLGPRADLALSPRAGGPFRMHLDAGAAFGSAHDMLGAIDVALLSGAASVTLIQSAGVISIEIGPRVEVGWVGARGTPISSDVRGEQLEGPFAAASLLTALGIQWSARWGGMFAVDVGDAFAGLQARADSRPTAGTIGPMLTARVGFSYAL